ncbi:MAG: F0F1 ATP synthase subunit gamma [Acidimicrobiia bacterium]
MPNNIKALGQEIEAIDTIGNLTDVFSNLASIQLRAIRQDVLNAKLFFNDLWQVYSQIRTIKKSPGLLSEELGNLAIIITSPAGLGGGSDQKIIQKYLKDKRSKNADVLVVGSNGVNILKAKNIKTIGAFELPDVSKDFSVSPLVDLVGGYKTTIVYYQDYISLGTQNVAELELLSSALELTSEEKVSISTGESKLISPRNFIFEPSIDEVIETLEDTMLATALTQLLMESRLSQLARRFTSMTLASQRARDMKRKLDNTFAGAKRARRDEMTRQTTISMRSK